MRSVALLVNFRIRDIVTTLQMFRLIIFASAIVWAWPIPTQAYEGDVHFGLTQWLAIQAGFDPAEAEVIATGDLRVASGDMSHIRSAFTYACPGHDPEASKDVENYDFAAAVAVPASPAERAVAAGGEAARKPLTAYADLKGAAPGYRLLQFGEALHLLQDSWSNQGIPGVPDPFHGSVKCDASLVWSLPVARGGASSHKANLTYLWRDDTIAMAKATFEALTRYAPINGRIRTVVPWGQVAPNLDGFISATTKAEKSRWFKDHGVSDTSFLEGVSLPDGDAPFNLQWSGRRLPAISSKGSGQHDVDPQALAFFDEFLESWATTNDFGRLVRDFTKPHSTVSASAVSPGAMNADELAARLGLWRVRDHGKVAAIVHSPTAFTPKQVIEANTQVHKLNAIALYGSARAAFDPMLPRTATPSPLSYFVLVPLPPSSSGNSRALAAVKFRHAPYDTLAVLAERVDGKWHVLAVDSLVEE